METTIWSRSVAIVLTIVLASTLGCTRCPEVKAPTTSAPANSKQIQDAISIVVQDYRAAYEARKIGVAVALYSMADDVTVTAQGRTTRGLASVRARIGAFLGAQTHVKLRITDLQVAVISQDAVSATAELHRTYGDGAQTLDDKGTLTLVMRKEADAWKIVSEHYSYRATE